MRTMLSFTACGGLAMPWAWTLGACIASARPTAVVSVDTGNRRRFMMSSSPVVSRMRDSHREDRRQSEKGYPALIKLFATAADAAGVFFQRRRCGIARLPDYSPVTNADLPDARCAAAEHPAIDAGFVGKIDWSARLVETDGARSGRRPSGLSDTS